MVPLKKHILPGNCIFVNDIFTVERFSSRSWQHFVKGAHNVPTNMMNSTFSTIMCFLGVCTNNNTFKSDPYNDVGIILILRISERAIFYVFFLRKLEFTKMDPNC